MIRLHAFGSYQPRFLGKTGTTTDQTKEEEQKQPGRLGMTTDGHMNLGLGSGLGLDVSSGHTTMDIGGGFKLDLNSGELKTSFPGF